MKHIIRTGCYKRRFVNEQLECKETLNVYNAIIKEYIQKDCQCPNDLVGGLGKEGPIGLGHRLKLDKDEIERILDKTCPFLIEK